MRVPRPAAANHPKHGKGIPYKMILHPFRQARRVCSLSSIGEPAVPEFVEGPNHVEGVSTKEYGMQVGEGSGSIV